MVKGQTLTAQQYLSNGQACFIPDSMNDTIILPANELEWITDQLDDVLNSYEQLNDLLQTFHTLADPYVVHHHEPHHKSISRELTRRLGDLTQDIVDELAAAVDEEWGTDAKNWAEVKPVHNDAQGSSERVIVSSLA